MSGYAVGTLVRARGRDWVVLPESDEEMLVVRPLGGTDAEVAGILSGLEDVSPATFPPPSPDDAGNAVGAGLLRTAMRIGFQSTGGPFRSLGGLAVEPRPYQLVPLLMALRQETVRLLIADDVGVGKTVEAGLVAAELLADGSARGLAVLCSPALAEQWQGELAEKFRLDAELVLASTVRRLQRGLYEDESVFDRHPITVVSTDFIKSPRHRDDFVRACPDLVIVDEAHTCVADGSSGTGRTQRYDLVRRLAANRSRHLLLVTATPHSGKDEGFRNLVGLLDPQLAVLDLAAGAGRERLARHMVQRRRADIRRFLEDTPFPSDRLVQERRYHLTEDYRRLFASVLAYARETVRDPDGGGVRQRVRYWSALALLRALASSPAAAATTLRTRARTVEAETVEDADRLGRATVLDLAEDEAAESVDVAPGADPDGGDPDDTSTHSAERRRLNDFARRAAALAGAADSKLATLDETVPGLLADGCNPVVFCRFIDTAEYVAAHLRTSLGAAARISCVTGLLPPAEREARIRELAAAGGPLVLVATDCLSEGINLQDSFRAVVHYDLAWNPTRHEQREGRVDRFGQRWDVVRAVTIVGADNQIDEIVMRVLLRKHEEIRRQLGVSVPVPDSANQVVEAVMEELLLAGEQPEQEALIPPADLGRRRRDDLHREWESTAARERESRTKFAQAGIRPEEVAAELDAARAALGDSDDVEAFVYEASDAFGSPPVPTRTGFAVATLPLPTGLRATLPPGHGEPLRFHRDLPIPRGEAHLDRTDPAVRALARYSLDAALDPQLLGTRPARRAGVMRTAAVERRTTLLLLRIRLQLTLPGRHRTTPLVAEEVASLAFRGRPPEPQWLTRDEVDALLRAEPAGNIAADLARDDLARTVARLPELAGHLDAAGQAAADRLRNAHDQVRQAGRRAVSGQVQVAAHTPPDVIGVYLYLPMPGGAR